MSLATPLARADGACPADAGGSKSERERERERERKREREREEGEERVSFDVQHSSPGYPSMRTLCALPPPPSSIQPTGALLLLSGHFQPPLERLM